jgi:hypothetical protein
MEGPTFRAMPANDLLPLLPKLRVLARSSPEDKLTLVGRGVDGLVVIRCSEHCVNSYILHGGLIVRTHTLHVCCVGSTGWAAGVHT